MIFDKHDQIRRRAYEIWESEGCPEGAELRHWQQACDELGGDNEHEMSHDLRHADDQDDAALLQGAGEIGDIDRRRGKSAQPKREPRTSVPEIEITTGERPSRQMIKKTEGP
ncbi:DUF2934 domain-containing protein [Ensifer sp. IC4062]|nr:DUF2934 domain-containing protein [Ensifer sp. IC4062]MCA1443761.1 DUF2934 domain-containing protein [Ensifer sp. IC4062]